jgi:hypothetical protein
MRWCDHPSAPGGDKQVGERGHRLGTGTAMHEEEWVSTSCIRDRDLDRPDALDRQVVIGFRSHPLTLHLPYCHPQ